MRGELKTCERPLPMPFTWTRGPKRKVKITPATSPPMWALQRRGLTVSRAVLRETALQCLRTMQTNAPMLKPRLVLHGLIKKRELGTTGDGSRVMRHQSCQLIVFSLA